MPHILSLTLVLLHWGGRFQNNPPCPHCSEFYTQERNCKGAKIHRLQFDSSKISLGMQAVCSYFGKTFGRLKVADKGIHRRTRAITLNYLPSESNLMESEQGYIVALCLPNLPQEKHRLVSYGKCAMPTKWLKGPAEWALGVSGNTGVSSFKREGEKPSVPQTRGKEGSQSFPGIAHEGPAPVTPEYCWYPISH